MFAEGAVCRHAVFGFCAPGGCVENASRGAAHPGVPLNTNSKGLRGGSVPGTPLPRGSPGTWASLESRGLTATAHLRETLRVGWVVKLGRARERAPYQEGSRKSGVNGWGHPTPFLSTEHSLGKKKKKKQLGYLFLNLCTEDCPPSSILVLARTLEGTSSGLEAASGFIRPSILRVGKTPVPG